jgi:hypothetical protein
MINFRILLQRVSANLSEIEKLLLVTGESKSGFQNYVSSPLYTPIDKTVGMFCLN